MLHLKIVIYSRRKIRTKRISCKSYTGRKTLLSITQVVLIHLGNLFNKNEINYDEKLRNGDEIYCYCIKVPRCAVFQTGNELFTSVEGKSLGKVAKIFSNKMNVEAQRQLNAHLFWLSYYLLGKPALDST